MNLYYHNDISFNKLSREDLPLLLDLKQESWPNTHRVSILNMDDQDKWYESLCGQSVYFPSSLILIAIASVSNKKVGVFKILNICWQNRRADVGWDVFKDYRNKGYGKKLVKAGVNFCFEILNLHRLRADILDGNEASQKCAEYAGFKCEGCEKEAVWKKDRYIDSYIYGIINNYI